MSVGSRVDWCIGEVDLTWSKALSVTPKFDLVKSSFIVWIWRIYALFLTWEGENLSTLLAISGLAFAVEWLSSSKIPNFLTVERLGEDSPFHGSSEKAPF